jgi:hypothetical protein
MSSKKRKYRETISTASGNALIDFDRLLRDQPPAQELVRAGEETRGHAGDGGDLRIELPDASEYEDAPSAEPNHR